VPARSSRPEPASSFQLTAEACWQAARIIANATFASRQAAVWGEGTTAVASDSTHFSAFDQNIFTEWHSRYRRAKRGVLIYWTVDTAGSMAVHSQLISCSASEVHAMVEGAMRHGTDMEIEQNFVDSHGASFAGFGITRLRSRSACSSHPGAMPPGIPAAVHAVPAARRPSGP
jgi:TnpA family transposase